MKIDMPRRGGAHGDLVSALVLAHAATSSGGAMWTAALQSFQRRGGADAAFHRIDNLRRLGR